MSRIKRGLVSKRKHNKVLELAKGYRGSRSRLIRTAKAAVLHSGAYAFQGRKNKKRDIRVLWIVRISEAVKLLGISYSKFIKQLHDAKIGVDRKMLAEIILNDPETFKAIVEKAKAAK